MPGGNCLPRELDQRRGARAAGAADAEERLWAVPAEGAARNGVLMKVPPTAIPDVLLMEPKVFGDERGFFMESFNQKAFDDAVGRPVSFVQDNHSRSTRGVLRGLHYQLPPHAQGKLVRVASGAVFDVAVDMRRGSATFGRWAGMELSADNHRQVWIPPGFAHGFLVLSEHADFLYQTTD